MTHRRVLAATALLFLPTGAGGQIPVAPCPLAIRRSPFRAEARCLEAHQGLLAEREWAVSPGRVSLLPVDLTSSYRSGYPVDRSNGLLWSGRGASAGASAGLALHMGRFTLALAPEVVWAENRDVTLPGAVRDGFSPYTDPWGVPTIDHYLRPGSTAQFTAGPGASFVEMKFGPARAGMSTESLWWGPGRRHSLLFSSTAPGFPHAYVEVDDVGTSSSGLLSVRTLWGRLDESAWFDDDSRNDHRLIGAAQASWRMGFVPGLNLALSVVRHERGGSMGSMSFRVALPETGMEAYGEFGRGEAFVNAQPGVSDTRYARVYLLGFSRTDTTGSGAPWRFSGEVIKQKLELPQPQPAQGGLPDAVATQGHTELGQLLGDWIGPGSNAQIVRWDWLGGGLPWGVFAERVRRDDDTYYRVHHRDYTHRGYDLEWTLGARAARALPLVDRGTVRIQAESGVSRRKNRSFIGLDGGANRNFLREWNLWGDLNVRWYP